MAFTRVGIAPDGDTAAVFVLLPPAQAFYLYCLDRRRTGWKVTEGEPFRQMGTVR